MRAEITSPQRAAAASTRAEWSAFARFLARPRLPGRTAPLSRRSLIALLRMYALDLLLMGGLALIATVVVAAGFELPETALAGMEIDIAVALGVIIGAPLGEEILFRGWLAGRKRQLFGALMPIIGVVAVGFLSATGVAGAGIWSVALLTIFGLLAIVLFWTARHRPPLRWFARLFPLFFWLSTAAFACIHLFNFDEGALWVLLPLVLPQFILGAILGYLRVHYGLWSSITIHALHNGTALGLVWIGMRFAGAGG